MKFCYACKQDKPLADFGKNRSKKDGLATECKTCKSRQSKKYHAANRDEHCKKMRVWRNGNLGQCQEKARAYARSEIGRGNNNRATRKYYDGHKVQCAARAKKRNSENPEKYKAEYIIGNAIRLGKVIRPKRCQACDKKGLPHAHHPDYSKPLDVIWLCRKCHGVVHRKRD